MNDECGVDLQRLFAEVPEPNQGEVFARRVSRRIALRRYVLRIALIVLAGLGAAAFASFTPWLIRQAGYLALGFLSASTVVAVVLSRVGWVLGLVVVVVVLVKSRT